LAAYYPTATFTPFKLRDDERFGTSDYATNVVTKAPWREENVRVDYNLTKKNAVTFRYTQDFLEHPGTQ